MDLDVVFQNIDGDGLPTLLGDVVMTCEAGFDKTALRRRLDGMTHFFPKRNYRMTISWNEKKTPLVKKRSILVHRSSQEPPTPRRDIALAVLDVVDNETAFIAAHAVNSAWAPRWKPTTFRKARRALWWIWYRAMKQVIARQLAKGRIVIVAIDGNRQGDWTFPGMTVVWHHGPDRLLVSERDMRSGRVIYRGVSTGAKTGNGRVTHPSIKATFEFQPGRSSD